MEEILLYFGIGLIILGYVVIFFAYMIFGNKKGKERGYDMAFRLLENDSGTKIVEGRDLFLSEYSIKRDAIRLSSRAYGNNDYFSLFVCSLLSGYALAKKCGSINIVSKLFKNYHFLSFSSILTIIFSLLSNTISDAKVGVLLFCTILFYQYLFFDYVNNATLKVKSSIHNNSVVKILKLNVRVNILFMVATLIELIRTFIIIFVR